MSASVAINDTSVLAIPTYAITAGSASVNEGGNVTFTVNTTNVASGTVIPYTLSGTGIAGADIAELSLQTEITARGVSEHGQTAFQAIEDANKPIIAAVNGFALGGGCELAMACHFRLASENAKFGQPEIKLGLIPGYGGTQRLTRLIGKSKALELLLTGDMINAQEALALGLVNYVLPTQEELLAKAESILLKIISMAPIAAGLIIDSVNAYYTDSNSFNKEANNFAACFRTDDMREGVNAFLEKRS
ncbi:MAG: enoyl-CoA hydratase, partial [Chitinophagia bacterium]|nr:enoyl-CoA hydratase [Chitinophagia bacterium]